jgi:hypothetical protein
MHISLLAKPLMFLSVADKFSFMTDLLDTPHFQTIKLPRTLGADDTLVVEIVDVYPGTKYEDTAINCILYDCSGGSMVKYNGPAARLARKPHAAAFDIQ